jgi:3'-5' exoribonuclease
MEEPVRNRVYAVREVSLAYTKSGVPYLKLGLWDGTERVDGRVWDGNLAEQFASQLKSGDVLFVVEGRWAEYGGAKQLAIEVLRLARAGEYDPAALRPRKDGTPGKPELLRVIGTVKKAHLGALLEQLLVPLLDEFVEAPAAKGNHHNYQGGLAEHTLEVVAFCEAAARVYPVLDRDLLVAAALLHDVGKLREYDSESVTFERTPVGKLVGHIVIGWGMVKAECKAVPGFPGEEALHLEHLILSHHGQREWGSPVEPQTAEAVALHHADLMSARVGQACGAVAGAAAWRT